jgi:chitodextrinase
MKTIPQFNLLMAGLFAVSALVLSSCGGDDEPAKPTASFTYDANGREVAFTSTSKNAKTFAWDFGDGATSTEENPSHTYDVYGDYTVKLSVTGDGGVATSLPDALTLSKTSDVKIDGNFAEWANIAEVTVPATNGTISKVKVDYDALNIYFYVEGSANLSGFMDLYLDTDNDPATGYFSGWYPEGFGADYLMEGDLRVVNDGDIFKDNDGEATAWGWTATSPVGSNSVKSSTTAAVGSGKGIEFSVSRAAFTNLASVFSFAIVDVDGNYYFADGTKSRDVTETWAAVGSFPKDNVEGGKLAQFDLTK